MFQLKELKERQKQQLRHKALKKGLDPEALTGKYPVNIYFFMRNSFFFLMFGLEIKEVTEKSY